MKPSEAAEILKGIEEFEGNLPEDGLLVEEAWGMAIAALEKQETDRWHSVVKEGNPKESGFYLWTSKDGTVREDYYQVRDDTWSKAWQFGYKVVAWKNEPKPYTEEEL